MRSEFAALLALFLLVPPADSGHPTGDPRSASGCARRNCDGEHGTRSREPCADTGRSRSGYYNRLRNTCADANTHTALACSGLVEYVAGDLPLILTAPHGGQLRPDHIPNRTQGTLLRDSFTDLLARDVADAVRARTGRPPHLILCHLHRVKVDCNREIGEGAQSNAAAAAVWQAFHDFIAEARDAATRTNTAAALLLDIHAHGHAAPRVELGYLLSRRQLALPEAELEKLAAQSSIRQWAEIRRTNPVETGHAPSLREPTSFVDLLRGPHSLGGLLEQRGFAATPSPANPASAGQDYFNGGYITRRYGSRDGGTLSAIQAECPGKGFRSPEDKRRAFADALADALVGYLRGQGLL